MKIMKRAISSFVTVCILILIVSLPVNARGNFTICEQREYLLDIGISGELVESLIDPQVEEMFLTLKGKDIAYVETFRGFLNENDELEFINKPDGNIPTSDLSLTVSIVYSKENVSANKQKIKDVSIFLTYNWKKLPVIRKKDAIAVNWNSSDFVFRSDLFSHRDYAYDGQTKSWILYKHIYAPSKLVQGGLGFYADISYINIKDMPASGLKGSTTIVLLPKNNPIYIQNPTVNSQVSINYVHDRNPLAALSLGFSVSGVTISVNPSTLQDSMAIGGIIKFSRT